MLTVLERDGRKPMAKVWSVVKKWENETHY